MYLRSLRLHNFRNYKKAIFQFSPGINIFSGKNAQGKTGVLEAIGLLSSTESFRRAPLRDLVRKGSDFFSIEAVLQHSSSLQESFFLVYQNGEKKLQYNATSYSSFTPLLGALPSVIHLPSDIHFVIGSPGERRRFFNIHLAQRDPLYARYLMRYSRAMKQRNALLKCRQLSSVDIWEKEMVAAGSYLTEKRQELMQTLSPMLRENATYFCSGEEVDCVFFSQIAGKKGAASIKNTFAGLLEKGREKDARLGFSFAGSHRDDFTFEVNGLPSKKFASEGQVRSIAIAMRLAQWEELTRSFGDAAIFCMDDFALGFDKKREERLRARLSSLSQVFYTTPYEATPSRSSDQVFVIENGSISKVL